jgi:predicted metal-dependent HD superfamily phosphohydrolase
VAAHDLELRAFWQRAVAPATGPLERLVARYREPHRRYHTTAHLGWVLRHVDELASNPVVGPSVGDLGAVIAAAFFHDAIYDPTSSRNEADSAALARAELCALGWVDDRTASVADMIAGTATHRDPPDVDTGVLYDADLAVLGADPAAYGDYVRGVRAEYSHLDDAAWVVGRRGVLRSFLDRPVIFATVPGRDRWEAVARANLSAELSTLS